VLLLLLELAQVLLKLHELGFNQRRQVDLWCRHIYNHEKHIQSRIVTEQKSKVNYDSRENESKHSMMLAYSEYRRW
jgi:hypothetical protein